MKVDVDDLTIAKSNFNKMEDTMMKLNSAMEHASVEHDDKATKVITDKDPKVSVADPAAFSLAQDFDTIVCDLDIPEFLKNHQTTLRFPEKVRLRLKVFPFGSGLCGADPRASISFLMQLMLLLVEVERMTAKSGKSPQKACLAWRPEGLSFVIRHGDDLVGKILPMVSCPAKFSSFLRKLYRWGFRQVVDRSVERSDKAPKNREKVFMHPYFQRDNKSLMDRMKSITAESTRKELATRAFIQKQESRLSKLEVTSAAPEEAMSCPGDGKIPSNSALHPFLHNAVPDLSQPQQRALAASLLAEGAQRSLGTILPPKAFDLCLTAPPSNYLTSSSIPLGASLGSTAGLPLSIHGLADQLVRDIRLRAAAADSLLLRNSLTSHQRPHPTRSLFTRPSLNDYLPPLSNVLTTTELGRLELFDRLVGVDFRAR